MQAALDIFLNTVVPILVGLGLFHTAAAMGRGLWAKFKGGTTNSVGIMLEHVLDPVVAAGLDMLDRGDVAGATAKLQALRALTKPKAKV